MSMTALSGFASAILLSAISALALAAGPVAGSSASEDHGAEAPTLSVHGCFGDRMVFQRGRPVKISGVAAPFTTVSGAFRGAKAETAAGGDGSWTLSFPAGAAGGPFEMLVATPNESVRLRDVLVGEVWICGGQSNMEYPVGTRSPTWGYPDGEAASRLGDSRIRLALVPRGLAPDSPRAEPPGRISWRSGDDPEAVKWFSAVGWFFGLELRRRLGPDMPIGLVYSCWGNTRIEPWISERTFANHGETRQLDAIAAAGESGRESDNATPATLFNAMIHPLSFLPVRGAIWYQGCSNADDPIKYRDWQREIVEDWRAAWNDPEFVFIGTQLAGYRSYRPNNRLPDGFWKNDKPGEFTGFAPIREAQMVLLDMPRCGLATALDVGDPFDIHPSRKRPVGERLAHEAMRIAYGDASAPPGPRGVRARVVGPGAVRVFLRDTGAGLELRGDISSSAHLFALFGEDGTGEWADARIDEDGTILVSAPSVAEPVRVEYAWSGYPPNPCLYRRADGIPLFPFRLEAARGGDGVTPSNVATTPSSSHSAGKMPALPGDAARRDAEPAGADSKAARRLVWSDEFNGTALDEAKWQVWGTMFSTDNVYTNDARTTVRVAGGLLRLRVLPTDVPGKVATLPRGLVTRDRMAFRYGYLEMLARVPYRRGAWPSFWLSSHPKLAKADWTSEIDVFESFASTNAAVANLHKWKGKAHVMLPGGEGSLKRAYRFPYPESLNWEFHVYAMDWTPQSITFLVDGEPFMSVPIDDAHDFASQPLAGMAGFHDPHYVILNNEVFTPGHGWCPEELRLRPEDNPFPIEYEIDWIRLWQGEGEELF